MPSDVTRDLFPLPFWQPATYSPCLAGLTRDLFPLQRSHPRPIPPATRDLFPPLDGLTRDLFPLSGIALFCFIHKPGQALPIHDLLEWVADGLGVALASVGGLLLGGKFARRE